MPLVVEDGTAKETANSYITVEFADTYFGDRGNALWAGSTTLKEQAIVRATDYIEKRFARKFRGTKQSRAQALSWPRFNAVDNSGFLYNAEENIPRKLKQAVAEYALRTLNQGELAPDPGLPVDGANPYNDNEAPLANNQSRVLQVNEKLGPMSTTTQYQEKSNAVAPKSSLVDGSIIPEYPAADMLLEELLINRLSRPLVRG